MDRSSRREVRNPLSTLDGVDELMELDPEVRATICRVLKAMKRDAAERAQHCWDRHKAPMATYWKGTSVNVGHFARLLK